MIKLVKGKVNTVLVKITSLLPIDGFFATLNLLGETKTIDDVTKRNISFDFAAADVAKFGSKGAEGLLSVLKDSGTAVSKQRIWFKPVDVDSEATGFQTIYVTITGDYGGGGGGTPSHGAVTKINGKTPDDNGNVDLAPADIGIGYDVDEDNENLTLYLD